MKVEIWSDIACPFCYIGKRSFEAALARFEHKDKLEVSLRSFELDPEAPKNSGENTYQMLAKKYRTSLEQAKQMTKSVSARATEMGLEFDFDKSIPTNLLDAHRLLHLARKHDREWQLAEKFFAGYFTDGKNLSDHTELRRLAVEVGLPEGEVASALASSAFEEDVRREEGQAHEIGISGVPAFVFAEKYLISGAQPPEAFLEAMEEIWLETHGS